MNKERLVYDTWINPLCNSIRNVVEVEKQTVECLESLVDSFIKSQTIDSRGEISSNFRSFSEYLTDQMPQIGVLMITDVHVRRCLKYLDDHIAEPYSLTAVASYSGMSRPALCRVFKAEVKHTISEYLCVLRMRKAMNLLCSSNLMVVEISELCGYGHSSHFIVHFKAYTGLTPLAYRNQKKQMGLG